MLKVICWKDRADECCLLATLSFWRRKRCGKYTSDKFNWNKSPLVRIPKGSLQFSNLGQNNFWRIRKAIHQANWDICLRKLLVIVNCVWNSKLEWKFALQDKTCDILSKDFFGTNLFTSSSFFARVYAPKPIVILSKWEYTAMAALVKRDWKHSIWFSFYLLEYWRTGDFLKNKVSSFKVQNFL